MAADAEAALADAARRGTARQVRAACALVRSTTGGDIDRRFGLGDVTPLHVAAWRGDARVVRALCDAGASLTARDGESGWSPLHRAFHHGNARAAAALLARGASLHAPLDLLGRSPLDVLTRALRRRFDDDALDRSRSYRPTASSTRAAAASAAASSSSSSSLPCDLYSWGSGVNFQLGTGAVSEQPTPRRVDDVAVAVPTSHGSAVGADDDDGRGSGGSGDTNRRREPCGGVVCASAGKFHTVCATADGAVYAWGHGRGGRLGVNVKAVYAGDEAIVSPARLATFGGAHPIGPNSVGRARLRVVAVAAGKHHTLAATECGLAFSWGLSRDGCLGYLTAEEEASAVSSSTRAVSSSVPSVGPAQTTSPNARKALASDEPFSPTPRRIAGTLKGIRIVAVAAANRHSVVLTAAGDVYAFGSNARGQLGVALGSAVDHCAFAQAGVDLAGKRSVADGGGRRCVGVACAKAHTVALTADGDAFQWGHGVPGGPRRVDIASGLVHRDGGTPGRFTVHQGVTSRATPGRLVAVAAGATTSLALTADGAVLAWRSDDRALRCSHVRGIPDGVVSVAAGKSRCAATTAAGDVYSWDATTDGKDAAPFRVAGIKRVVSVCVGEKHSLALQRIARPPRETIPTLADEDYDADEEHDDAAAAARESWMTTSAR